MGTRRSRFAGGDQAYLKDEQYRDPSRLAARTNLHLAYGTASVPWFDWVLQTAALSPGSSVLEVGCGGGALWASDRGQRSELALTLVDLSAGMVSTALEHASSGSHLVADTVTTFGIESGARMLEAVCEDARWVDYPDELVCTEPADLLAYLRSLPPAEDATGEQAGGTARCGRRSPPGTGGARW
jgi:SAM-dependent methyltransferase